MGLLDDLLGELGGAGLGPRTIQRREPTSLGGNMDMKRILMALLPVVLAMLARRNQGQAGAGRPASTGGGGLGDVLGGMLGGGAPAGAGGGTGGGLGDILGSVLGGGSGTGGLGGLGGLVEAFQRAGLGQQAQSWVGTGANAAISAESVEKVFGPGGLGEIARQSGLTEKEASMGLATLLPEVVNHVTPQGELPSENQLTASVTAMMQRLGAASPDA
jgi:uncharacterized protein YidB (DUF937 family)